MPARLSAIPVFLMLAATCAAQTRTVGTLRNDSGAAPGYVLYAPNSATTTYLVDNEGRQIRWWNSAYPPGQAVYLREDGSLLRSCMVGNQTFRGGGSGGGVQIFSWEGALLWDYRYSTPRHCLHHDLKPLPNGNVLVIAWEKRSAAEAIAAGRDPARLADTALWPDCVLELKPSGATGAEIVWEWHAWDHLVQDLDTSRANYGDPAAHPELVDINYPPGRNDADWLHCNAVDYNAALDQVIISVHNPSEIWIVDHGTSTAEAAGHSGGRRGRGGDLLYRWGNPAAYGRGTQSAQQFFGQHDAQWIADTLRGAGNILVFNNGLNRPAGAYSTIEEITPPLNADSTYDLAQGQPFAPAAADWIFAASPPSSLYSGHISGAQRLPNGNTLICNGANGIFLEAAPDGRIVWEYVNPVTDRGILTQGSAIPGGANGRTNSVFKIRRYPPEFPAFRGRDVTPGDFVERYTTDAFDAAAAAPQGCSIGVPSPHPVRSEAVCPFSTPVSGAVSLTVCDMLGRELRSVLRDVRTEAGLHRATLPFAGLPPGVYALRLQAAGGAATRLCVHVP